MSFFCFSSIGILLLIVFTSTNAVTLEEMQQHDSSSDCWSAIYGKVYDLTEYGDSHGFAGGPQRVWDSCGIDYTDEFDRVHGDSKHYLQWEGIVEIGDLIESSEPPTTTVPATPMPETSERTTSLATETTIATEPPVTTPNGPHGTTSRVRETTRSYQTDPEPTSTTTLPETSPTTMSEPPATTIEAVTLDELASHDSPNDCWVLFYDLVYDLTEYAYRHPVVGEDAIHPYCGTNGTDAFAGAHDKSYLGRVNDLVVGPLSLDSKTEPPPTTSMDESTMTENEVAKHSSPSDCWVVFYGGVYDMTQYAYSHPGPGEQAIHPWCGLDGTTAFDVFHAESLLSRVEYTRVGNLSTSAASETGGLLFVAIYSVIVILSVILT